MSIKLLEDVTVVELANFIAAATAGRFLADLGATVIKIESAQGDPLRYTAPTEGRPLDQYENTTWDLENANKQCISIDTRTEEGKEVLFKLLDKADILLTNWRINSLKKQGLDYETLHKKYPKLVYGFCTGYGEHGPDRDLPGFDFTAFFARGGYLEAMRQKNDRPFNPIPGSGDHNVGMNLAAGLLAALHHARKTGQGEKVETSLFETAVYNLGMLIQAAQYPEIGMTYPVDVRESNNPFIAAWHTRDNRYIQTCMPNYNQYFHAFLKALELDDIVEDERYYPIQNLTKNHLNSVLYDRINERFLEKDLDEWKAILTDADVPFGTAASFSEILEDPQAWENNCLYTAQYPKGERTLVRLPVKFQEAGVPDYDLAGIIGQNTREVLEGLGYQSEQIDDLYQRKIAYTYEGEQS